LVFIAANGKGLCEVRATATESRAKNCIEQKPFSFFQNYKKIKNEMVFCVNFIQISQRSSSTPHLAKPMLCVVYFIHFH